LELGDQRPAGAQSSSPAPESFAHFLADFLTEYEVAFNKDFFFISFILEKLHC
jgi:hypothetical protein